MYFGSIELFLILLIVIQSIISEIDCELQQADLNKPKITQETHKIEVVGENFVLDGKDFKIRSGSLHYFRLPHQYWADRLQKLKAAGLNAVSTYVEWSFHEPEERQYSFEGDRDLPRFLSTAAKEGLVVLLRVGPYICAERDLGGFPYWLYSKYPDIQIRTTDTDFMRETKIWLDKLFSYVTPFLYGNGGPVILVQVENEYGSWGSDRAYKEQLRDLIKTHVGSNALLYTTDGAGGGEVDGGIEGTVTTIDFGTGSDVTKNLRELRNHYQGPAMNSEYYTGWLTHWGENSMNGARTANVLATLEDLFKNKFNFNMYMFFGGTNFEFTSGANNYYQPTYDVTSYDYDAPLTEAGDPTEKYFGIRDAMIKRFPEVAKIPAPKPSPKGAYGYVTVRPVVVLLSEEGRAALGKKYEDVLPGKSLPTFESLRQRAGLMLYETKLDGQASTLRIETPHDRAYVYVDQKYQGLIQRNVNSDTLPIPAGSKLSILVENMGRVNQPTHVDLKGLIKPVTLNNNKIEGSWSITGYPLNPFNMSTSEIQDPHLITLDKGPVVYEGQFVLPAGQEPLDTYIDPRGWGKGYIWINGHNLGRYWPSYGPQMSLYVPGVWLHSAPAHNSLQILELEGPPWQLSMAFVNRPIMRSYKVLNQDFYKASVVNSTSL